MIQIGVAAYSGEPNRDLVRDAERFIEELSRTDLAGKIVFVLGGYWGLMRYIADAACSYGFRSVFILPEHPRETPPAGECFIHIYTGLDFRQRSEIIVLSSDALVVMGGSVGTIIEVFMSAASGRPIFILRGYGLPSDTVGVSLEALSGYIDFHFSFYDRDPVALAKDLYRYIRKKLG